LKIRGIVFWGFMSGKMIGGFVLLGIYVEELKTRGFVFLGIYVGENDRGICFVGDLGRGK
jgi:hypothetical protein